MYSFSESRALCVVTVVLVLATSSGAQKAPTAPDVQRRLAEIEATTGGRAGVAAIRIEDGRRITFNARQTFPLASVRKLPIAMAILARVDTGAEQLDRTIRVEPGDVLVSGGTPANKRLQAGSTRTVRQLIELMMLYSDNTACAALQRTVMSAASTQAHLRALGVNGVRIDREPRALFEEVSAVQALPAARRSVAMSKLEADPRDAAEPESLAELLMQLQRGSALGAASTGFLLDAMSRSETGLHRLRAGLPKTARVADKTGTLGRTVNDVGIVTMPDGSHVAMVVLLTAAQAPVPACEKAIATTARTLYEALAAMD